MISHLRKGFYKGILVCYDSQTGYIAGQKAGYEGKIACYQSEIVCYEG
ncbi:hypothetical protein [Saccharicrinis sp. 156]